ncbi:uncharacterized, partial [Tachysurus ichikawai]
TLHPSAGTAGFFRPLLSLSCGLAQD